MSQLMAMMLEANWISEESTKARKEVETTFKTKIEELGRENAQLRELMVKLVHIEQGAENAKGARKYNKFISKWVRKPQTNLDPTRSKMDEPVIQVLNYGTGAKRNLKNEILVDSKKEMMAKLAKIVP